LSFETGRCPIAERCRKTYVEGMVLQSVLDRVPRPWRGERRPVVAVLRLGGVIGAPTRFRGGLSISSVAPLIERAFGLRGVKAVALAVNSPGGSAVQSSLICRRIRALADEKKLPVYSFAEDIAASGGYWLACAGDHVYADESSIIGSIGVIYSGFGFAEMLSKLGIERRLHTVGDRKALLDPFGPEKPADLVRLKLLQKEIHASFKQLVRERRAGKLKASERKLFSGEFWTGSRALELGLVDGIGDMRSIMRARFGDKVRFRMVGARRSLWRQLGRVPASLGDDGAATEGWADRLIGALEARQLWSRYGL